jgi:aldose 1-epimerase
VGELVRLAGDDVEVELLPSCGGRVHRIRAFGFDLLRTPPDPSAHRREPFFWGAFPMVPWCNRVPGARFAFGGRDVQLEPNLDGTAIHGEAYEVAWEETATPGRARFRQAGCRGFPWPYEAEEWVLVDGGVELGIALTNTGAHAMPAGVGLHPWWNASVPLEIGIPAGRSYDRVATVPVGAAHPVAPELDFRVPRPAVWGTDDLLTGLAGDTVSLRWPEQAVAAQLTFSGAVTHVQVAAFEDFQAVAVEPQTHAGDGFGRLERREAGAAQVLAPGETLTVVYRLEVQRA